jgi:uncharacterized radical SAM superfamily protein
VDDDFPRAEGFEQMLKLLRDEIRLPFMINAHPGSVTDEMAKALKEAAATWCGSGWSPGASASAR